MKPSRDFDTALELLTRLSSEIPTHLEALEDEMAGQPRAARYDSEGASHQWCWTHERDVAECHDDNLDCTGETFQCHDPTGEAAVRHDKASTDYREFVTDIALLLRIANRMTDNRVRHRPARLDIVRSGIGECSRCHRYYDGARNNRISAYKGGDPVCLACRQHLDRTASRKCSHPRVRWRVGEDGYGHNRCELCGEEVAA